MKLDAAPAGIELAESADLLSIDLPGADHRVLVEAPGRRVVVPERKGAGMAAGITMAEIDPGGGAGARVLARVHSPYVSGVWRLHVAGVDPTIEWLAHEHWGKRNGASVGRS